MAGNAWCEGLIQSTYSCCSHPATPGHGHRDCWREKKFFVLRHARGWYVAAPESDASCSALSWIVAKQKVLFEMEASQVQCMNWIYLRKLWNLLRTRVPSLHSLAFSITHSLTHWCFWDSFDVTLAENDAKWQSVDVIDCWCYCSWVDDSDSLT